MGRHGHGGVRHSVDGGVGARRAVGRDACQRRLPRSHPGEVRICVPSMCVVCRYGAVATAVWALVALLDGTLVRGDSLDHIHW